MPLLDTSPSEPEVATALRSARARLLAIQREDGHWCGELEGDSILESEYVLTLHFLGRAGEKTRKAAAYIRGKQLPDGGWAIYPGGGPEVSSSVKAYFALKLEGEDARSEPMQRARRAIEALGGLDACNSFTKIYLAIFGQYDWDRCPAVPPELVLLPDAFPLSIYRMSSWSRAIVVPLSIIWAKRPSHRVPDAAGLSELAGGAPAPRRPTA